MKKLVFFLMIIIIISCTKDDGCIEENKITNSVCPLNYNPVCGCNGKTYSNICEAERDGVISWQEGEC